MNASVVRWWLLCQEPLDTGFQLHVLKARVQCWDLSEDQGWRPKYCFLRQVSQNIVSNPENIQRAYCVPARAVLDLAEFRDWNPKPAVYWQCILALCSALNVCFQICHVRMISRLFPAGTLRSCARRDSWLPGCDKSEQRGLAGLYLIHTPRTRLPVEILKATCFLFPQII